MNKIRAGGLATVLLFGLALLVSGCAGTPPADGNAQASKDCSVPLQTGSRLSRRTCRDSERDASEASDD